MRVPVLFCYIAFFLIAALVSVGCRPRTVTTPVAMHPFEDPSLSFSEVVTAAYALETSGTPCATWRKVSNDRDFSAAHRQLAAAMLLRCGLEKGHPLIEASGLCAGSDWLTADAIYRIDLLGGEVPIDWPMEGCGFAINLHAFGAEEGQTAYLALSRMVESDELYRILIGAQATARDEEVLDIVIFPGYW
jgi:hypothetical protein